MKNKIVIYLLFVSLFFSCAKSTEDVNVGKELVIEFSNGEIKTFSYKGDFSMAFSFSHYKDSQGYNSGLYVFNFDMFTGAMTTNYSLELAKSDDNITIDNNYVSGTPGLSLLFSSNKIAPNNIITNATRTELQFTKFQNPGIIEGTFKAFLNSSVWCKGTFKFNSQ